MLSLVASVALATSPIVAYEDPLPTTLSPLYRRSGADARAQALVYEPLFYRSAIS